MKFNSYYLYIGIFIAVIALALYFLFPRRSESEGFQTFPSSPTLIGDPETCRIMKNILDSTNSQIEKAQAANDSSQMKLMTVTKASIEEQYAALKCS